MADQVRRGIEGLLGLPALRSLQESLRKYATNRRGQIATPSDIVVRTVQSEIEKLDEEITQYRRKIDEIAALLPRLLDERDRLSTELAAFGGGSLALVEELLRDEERLRSEADRLVEKLMQLLAGDVALALSGSGLRHAAVLRLRAEAERKAWESGRDQGRSNLERFLSHLDERLEATDARLNYAQRESVRDSARAAWEALWHPPPEGCAQAYLHVALDDTTRSQAVSRLEMAGRRSSGELRDMLRQLRDANEGAEAKKRERLSIELVAPEADAKRRRLEEVSEEIGRLKEEKGTAERALEAAEGHLAAKSAELGRHTDRIGRGEAPLRRAKRAEEIAAMIDGLLAEAVPTQVGEVADVMTRAWHAMARKKGFVERIEITPKCEVRLLNRRGEDLRQMQLSAGEEQIFTLALIHAIAEVSGRDFPFVVDTPLARLDEEHRLGVLRYFTERTGQVILLSTDTEVTGPNLDAIRKRIIAAYRLSVRVEDGITVTSVQEGYFERI
jgi:DNA sulfur modification protein DndD